MAVIDKKIWRQALIVFGRMSGWVATPVLLAVFLGRYFDAKYSTGDRYFFIMIGVGFFVSIFGIYRESKKYQRAVDREESTVVTK